MIDTRPYVDKTISLVKTKPELKSFLLGGVQAEDTSDLAD